MISRRMNHGLLKNDFSRLRRRHRFFGHRCGRRLFHGYRLRRRFRGRFCGRFRGRRFGSGRFGLRSRCGNCWRGLGRERRVHGLRRNDLRRAFGHDGRADFVAWVQLGNGDDRVAPVQADTALVDFALREFVNLAVGILDLDRASGLRGHCALLDSRDIDRLLDRGGGDHRRAFHAGMKVADPERLAVHRELEVRRYGQFARSKLVAHDQVVPVDCNDLEVARAVGDSRLCIRCHRTQEREREQQ